jgi:hypothetical protein
MHGFQGPSLIPAWGPLRKMLGSAHIFCTNTTAFNFIYIPRFLSRDLNYIVIVYCNLISCMRIRVLYRCFE